jgi:hypothetical protein
VLVVLKRGTDGAAVASTTVSAEVASSGAAQDAQNRLFWEHSREQAGHRGIQVEQS